jgi:DNA-binding response OmpR family regulator
MDTIMKRRRHTPERARGEARHTHSLDEPERTTDRRVARVQRGRRRAPRPFAYAELLARIRALLRRDLVEIPDAIEYGALRIDTAAHMVTSGGTPVELRRMEYALLVHLAHDPDRVYTKTKLLRDVWGYRSRGSTTTVASHASRLRCALARAGGAGWVSAIWGIGYRLAPRLPAAKRDITTV